MKSTKQKPPDKPLLTAAARVLGALRGVRRLEADPDAPLTQRFVAKCPTCAGKVLLLIASAGRVAITCEQVCTAAQLAAELTNGTGVQSADLYPLVPERTGGGR